MILTRCESRNPGHGPLINSHEQRGVCIRLKKIKSFYNKNGRLLYSLLVREVQGIRLTELAEMTEHDLSSLSIAASRIEKKAQTDKALAQKLVHFKNKLLNQHC